MAQGRARFQQRLLPNLCRGRLRRVLGLDNLRSLAVVYGVREDTYFHKGTLISVLFMSPECNGSVRLYVRGVHRVLALLLKTLSLALVLVGSRGEQVAVE